MALDVEPQATGHVDQHHVEIGLERSRHREVLDGAARRADEMVVVVARQVLRQLVAGELVVGHDAPDDTGLLENDQVAVERALGEPVALLQKLGHGQRAFRAAQDVDEEPPIASEPLIDRAESCHGAPLELGRRHLRRRGHVGDCTGAPNVRTVSAPPYETPSPGRVREELGTAAVSLIVAGAVAWVVSAFLPWLGRGSGSVMSLRDVGDLLLEDRWSTVPRWVGLVAYIVPICGGLALIAAGLERTVARRIVTVLVIAAATIVVVATIVLVTKDRAPALGFVLAVVGTLLEGVGVVAARARTLPSLGDGNK